MLLKTAVVQMNVAYGDPETNYKTVENKVAQAVEQRADVIVLPELWTTGYDFDYMKENPDTEATQAITFLSELARRHRVNLVAGSVAKKTEKGLFNTMLVFNRHGGLVKEYSKAHLFRLMEEEKHLSQGDAGGMFKLEHGYAAGFVCYDIRFPEWMRTHMLHPEHQPDVLYVVAEWPKPRIEQWRALLIARAIENQSYVVACNRTGDDPNNTFGGHSIVISPLGEVIAELEEEDTILYAEFETEEVHEVRKKIPIFQDRRVDMYRL